MQLSEIKKTVINVLTLIVTVGPWIADAAGLVHLSTDSLTLLSTVLGLAGSVLHWLVPNTTTDPIVAQTQSVRLKGFEASRGAPA